MKDSAIPERKYYPELDGLRGIAIILVICCHNFGIIPLFEYGWIGVDLFFVLSGFLISMRLLETINEKNFFLKFYKRRILRIFPLYILSLIIFLILTLLLKPFAQQFFYFKEHIIFALSHSLNIQYIIYKRPPGDFLLSNLWSLSLEEQFYLIWPLLIFLLKKSNKLVLGISLLLIAVVCFRFLAQLNFKQSEFRFTLQRMTCFDGFCAGSLLAIYITTTKHYQKKLISLLSVALLSSHLLIYVYSKFYQINISHFEVFVYSSLATIFSVAILFLLNSKNQWIKHILTNQHLRYLGKISYGLYIFHWPVLLVLKIYLLSPLYSLGINNVLIQQLLVGFIAILLALLLSVVSYKYYEKPFLKLKTQFV